MGSEICIRDSCCLVDPQVAGDAATTEEVFHKKATHNGITGGRNRYLVKPGKRATDEAERVLIGKFVEFLVWSFPNDGEV